MSSLLHPAARQDAVRGPGPMRAMAGRDSIRLALHASRGVCRPPMRSVGPFLGASVQARAASGAPLLRAAAHPRLALLTQSHAAAALPALRAATGARVAGAGAGARIMRAALRTRAGPAPLGVCAPKDASSTEVSTVEGGGAVAQKPPSWLQRTWEYVKKEAHHYKMGCVLLYKDVRTAIPLVQRVLLGYTLSRREHNLLVRVVADMSRLVPFLFFIIVPFMEFALPFALKLFPGMLPSTFETKFQKEEELKRKLKAKIELARVMQDAVEEMAREWSAKQARTADKAALEGEDCAAAEAAAEEATKRRAAEAEALRELVRQVRAGEAVDNAAIIKIAKLFRDELTLSNMPRTQLVLMCQTMGLRPLGADAFLRFQLRSRVRKLKSDDRMILFEGVGSLSDEELLVACADRGMRALDTPVPDLRRQLTQWLELSMDQNIPITLLILANGLEKRSAAQPAAEPTGSAAASADVQKGLGVDPAAAAAAAAPAASAPSGSGAPELHTTLSEMSERLVDAVVMEDEIKAKAQTGEALTMDERVAELEKEMRRIEEEYAAAQHEAQLAASRLTEAPQQAATATAAEGDTPPPDEAELAEAAAAAASVAKQKLADVVEAAELLASDSAVVQERLDVDELESVRQQALAIADAARNDRAIQNLDARCEKMIADLKKQVSLVDEQIGEKMHVLDLDGDGIITVDELKNAVQLLMKGKDVVHTEQQWQDMLDMVDPDHDGRIEKEQLRAILRELEETRAAREEEELRLADADDEAHRMETEAAARAAEKLADPATVSEPGDGGAHERRQAAR